MEGESRQSITENPRFFEVYVLLTPSLVSFLYQFIFSITAGSGTRIGADKIKNILILG
jgi:hypothetical protein